MYAYKIKELAKRGTALLGAAGMLAGIGTTAIPVLVSADALNPLTERSLTLSSSSPGWSYLDGSNNTTYAPPNSGANGQKTGNFFSFKTSSPTTSIKGFTFQYCTTPAGNCLAPGNNGWSGTAPSKTRNADTTSTTDLAVHSTSAAEITTAWSTIQARQSGVTAGQYAKTPLADNSEGNFIILKNGTPTTGWSMSISNKETGTVGAGTATGKSNLITLTNAAGVSMTTSDVIDVKFYGTNTNYITNPGDGAFFVKINNYSDDTDVDPITSTHIVDGGVTVANVMNQSISIQTKVLETMDFSVGVFDPNTLTYPTTGNVATNDPSLTAHAQCAAILRRNPTLPPADYAALSDNVLRLGDPNGEYSLQTGKTWDTFSYWRLSSNSSGGATVYYTGHTLTNTVGDEIKPLDDTTGHSAQIGTEQFGLGIDHLSGSATIGGNSVAEVYPTGDSYGNVGDTGSFVDWISTNSYTDEKAHSPRLYPLVPATSYGSANGDVTTNTPKFAFNKDADSFAVPIASENTDVVNCTTAKMRYIANIAATTPAGVYTTKVNYVASPQY
ncbi:hypothetical protein EYC59_02715 [Candidatus Saccharibacteria bacterium]|nr:MAG: hypothetical protein EYC59_02715 [Candidatus Saccharibacteria bacterium]